MPEASRLLKAFSVSKRTVVLVFSRVWRLAHSLGGTDSYSVQSAPVHAQNPRPQECIDTWLALRHLSGSKLALALPIVEERLSPEAMDSVSPLYQSRSGER